MRKFGPYFMLLFIFFGCKDEQSKPHLNKNDKVVSSSKLLNGWKTYSKDSVTVNIPSLWKPQSINDALLYVPIDKKMDLYYVVLNYNSSRILPKDYLKEIFSQVSKKNPKFKYLLKQVSVKNGRDFYILELYITDKNTRYKIYSVIYDSGSEIYDFSYKTLDDEKVNAKNYQTFYSVLFSFEHEDDIVIDVEKFIIKNHKIIRYQDL